MQSHANTVAEMSSTIQKVTLSRDLYMRAQLYIKLYTANKDPHEVGILHNLKNHPCQWAADSGYKQQNSTYNQGL